MKKIINLIFILLLSLIFATKSYSETIWINEARSSFLSNKLIIYAINIRTFNAKDNNNNGIIEEELGEEKGTFLNAIDRLDELSGQGINTIHLLPITKIGKVKAMGTAGSLYAASSFNELNTQLKSPNNNLSIDDEIRQFIDECHKRKINVIVDMPACGSYDLYLNNPNLFKMDKNQNPVIPGDWTDVRLLNAGDDSHINPEVYNLYKSFIDLMINLNADGVVADVATLKPYSFWKKLINETRVRNPQFLFLAQASDSTKEALSEYATYTPYNKLLDAGFDGYYGSYSKFKDWKTAKELISHIKFNIDLAKKYSGSKSVIGSFATHDQVSPLLLNGPQFCKMIIWLNATLPLNSYYVDGFSTGDTYMFPLMNKKARKTFTDDEYYFVHRGQLDIFNFSRRPGGNNYEILQDFIIANKFKLMTHNIASSGTFVPINTSVPCVFAYLRSYDNESYIVIGNLDFKKTQNACFSKPKLINGLDSIPIKLSNIPIISKDKITTTLAPGEIQVLYFKSFK